MITKPPQPTSVLTKSQTEFLLERIRSSSHGKFGGSFELKGVKKHRRIIEAEKTINRLQKVVDKYNDELRKLNTQANEQIARRRVLAKQSVLFANSEKSALRAVDDFTSWIEKNFKQ